MGGSASSSLSNDAKSRVLAKIQRSRAGEPAARPNPAVDIDSSASVISEFWEYKKLQIHREVAERAGIANPYFLPQEGVARETVTIGGKPFANFSSYNYLGLCGDPRVNQAAMDAVEAYGTSSGASRVVSGEKPVHQALERAIANMLGTQDAVVMVSGHATNVSAISTLLGPRDLVIYDRLAHNSLLEGAKASGAKMMVFAHNDPAALEDVLARARADHERTLIAVEGVYSMDGDVAPIDRFVELKRKYKALLMVDEAHSVGVLGARGRGIVEHFGLNGDDVDIWMGTLSKSLAGCGGYIAGSEALIDLMKFTVPGFVYSVGMSPPVAAAALSAIEIMLEEPWRVSRLNANARLFRDLARERGLDVGLSDGFNIVPVIVGRSLAAGRLAHALFDRGINVHPIVYPAVQEQAARLRFFLSSTHDEQQIRDTVSVVAEEMERVKPQIEDE